MKIIKHALFTSVIALSITASAPTIAHAKDLYLSFKAGISKTSDAGWSEVGFTGDVSVDTTANFAGALGLRVNDNLRAEIELSYRNADLDKITVNGVGSANIPGELQTTSAMLIGYYDLKTGSPFRPYLSFGAGLLRHDVDIPLIAGITTAGYSADDTVLGGQLGAGASYFFSDHTALTGGYRYMTSKDMSFSGTEFEYDAHEIRLGLRHEL